MYDKLTTVQLLPIAKPYSLRIEILAYPTCIRRCRLGASSEYYHEVWYEKTEWCGYTRSWCKKDFLHHDPMVKNFSRHVYSFRHNPRTCTANERTDGHSMTTALNIESCAHDGIGRANAQHLAAIKVKLSCWSGRLVAPPPPLLFKRVSRRSTVLLNHCHLSMMFGSFF